MLGKRDVVRAILGRAGRTKLAQRVLGWYEREGFISRPTAVPDLGIQCDDLRNGRDVLFIAHYTGVNHWPVPDSIGIAPGGGRYVVVDVPLDA
jgi:hypothetical protein